MKKENVNMVEFLNGIADMLEHQIHVGILNCDEEDLIEFRVNISLSDYEDYLRENGDDAENATEEGAMEVAATIIREALESNNIDSVLQGPFFTVNIARDREEIGYGSKAWKDNWKIN